jgi:long-chain acyl-CoA synthetase
MFTSGTAGAPRAAMLSHGNLLANLDQSLSANGHIDADDVIFGVLPLFHIFGLNVVIGLGLRVGATLLLVQRFDPSTAVQSIQDRGVTVIPGAPALWAAFAHFDDLAPDAFASVRLALSGASRLPISVAEAMRARFGIEIREGYGLTEASPIVTTSTGGPVRFGSVGRVLAGVEIRLVSADGDALVGDVGEIWVRGANVFQGYYDDPEATSAVLTEDGWLRTGDMATADDDGYLYLVDRSKDLIIVSGFNVYPAEVEEMLLTHPAVAEVAVVGVPHPHTGEAVKAYVVTVPGNDVDEDTLIEYSLDHLARYKCPSKVIFVDALPRNASGKLVRRSLDDALRVGASRL